MPSIKSIGTAVPSHAYGNEQIVAAAAEWLKGSSAELALFERFVGSAQTGTRHFSVPVSDILRLDGMGQRAAIFESRGAELGLRSVRRALESARLDPAELDAILFTSCSSPVIPSIDCLLVEAMGMRRSVLRLPIYQHGCAGGVIGLSLADKLARSGQKVLLTSVELCSLGFQYHNLSPSNLVGSAIFGDGSASVVITPDDEGLVFLDSQSILTKNSRHLMGYDIRDDGTHLRLDKELPGFLSANVPKLVADFLARQGLAQKEIAWWLFHPGGARILGSLQEAFQLEDSQAVWAWDVLRDVGNLSSASILFVTERFLEAKVAQAGDYILMVGVGPGLTVELILFQMRPGR